jgi:replication initiation protein RepC
MCILILDASRDRPGLPVKNPGGYLRGMTRAAERGQLNLIGSLIGLSERKKHEND